MKQPNHQRSSVTPADFRRALGRFASGVTIITALTPKGRPEGMTVSAFCSLSLTPPLVLACIAKNTRSHDIFESASHFVVNILAENQRHLSVAFSRKSNNRFRELSWATWESGAPVLDGCVANLECSRT
ncbi:MAG: flavin reductase family protein, partial [Alphaproteobacteria bacterium]|nr:flavin reductase family protein [Alphaproteobacteria bacterium]